jgi:predicted dehydrogenase
MKPRPAHLVAFVLSSLYAVAQEPPPPLRAGMIGLDTSHVPAFTRLFNNPKADGDLAGITVVAGYPGGTDMPASKTRVEKFTEQVRAMGVEIVDSIPKLLEKSDVILLESVDGRIHLAEAREAFKAGKPVFIDKPLAGTLAEAVVLFELAKKHNVRCFSSSSSRFGTDLVSLIGNAEIGEIVGATTWGPCSYQSGTPDLFFYAIHGVESLFTLMGPGCKTVSRSKNATHDQVTGVWKDGRVGTYRGILKGKAEFGATVYGTKSVQHGGKVVGYEPLCRQIGRFFRTGAAPVAPEETLEIFAFMEAADESERQGGRPVELAAVLEKARSEAAAMLAQFPEGK